MENTLVIVLNAPPNSGKDVVANYLSTHYDDIVLLECKTRAIEIVKAVFGVSGIEWEQMYTRENKETPHWKLRKHKGSPWLSPREALIFICEEIIKPQLGKEYFGVDVSSKIVEGKINIISDIGFEEEVFPLFDKVGRENVVCMYIEREGNSNTPLDSRKRLIESLFHTTYTIINPNTFEGLFNEVDKVMESVMMS